MASGHARCVKAVLSMAWLACSVEVGSAQEQPTQREHSRKAKASTHSEKLDASVGEHSENSDSAKERANDEQARAYRKMQKSWHAPTAPPSSASEARGARPPLVLSPVNGGDPVVLVPARDDGGFSDEDLQRAARVFAPHEIRKVHPLAPRLLDLVYRSMRHFEATVVHVVSGYRRDRAGSRHTQGRAVDLVVAGISNERLAAYLRELGFVGVGIYPKSGFVHLDVRDASYFWSDDSAPGEPSRYTPILEAKASSADVAARARGEAPDVYVPNNIAEDVAAAKAYARRARARNAAARHTRHETTTQPE
jgi:uncharacterized protein YcbK (DUF882 family)